VKYGEWITRTPGVLLGKPCIKGTRISVELILSKLSQGVSIDELLTYYPHITREGILACIEYANEVLKTEKIYSV
jgi:uncharacterized protein (DUF433 family)